MVPTDFYSMNKGAHSSVKRGRIVKLTNQPQPILRSRICEFLSAIHYFFMAWCLISLAQGLLYVTALKVETVLQEIT
jgi:hypothetical protein